MDSTRQPLEDVDFFGRCCFCGVSSWEAEYSPVSNAVHYRAEQDTGELTVPERVHEYMHRLRAAMPIFYFIRQVGGCINDYIEFIGGMYEKFVPQDGSLTAPAREVSFILEVYASFLEALFDESRLVVEASAVFHSLQWLRMMKRDGIEQADPVDVDRVERLSIDGTEQRIQGFRDVYSRFDRVCNQCLNAGQMAEMYALSGPPPWVPMIPAAPSGVSLRLKQYERLMRANALSKVMEETDSLRDWDTPTERLLRALDVAEQIPWLAGGWPMDDVVTFFRRRLRDFDDTLVRMDASPAELSHPFFESFLYETSPTDLCSHQIWSDFRLPDPVQRSSSESVYYSTDLGTDEALIWMLNSNGPTAAILKTRNPPSRWLHIMRERDATICMRIMMGEFYREQLRNGEGLHCFFDMFENLDHSSLYDDGRQMEAHARFMARLWRSIEPSDKGKWRKPDCAAG